MSLDEFLIMFDGLTIEQKQDILVNVLNRAIRTGNKIAIAMYYANEVGLIPPHSQK